jgi:hypothetical protein
LRDALTRAIVQQRGVDAMRRRSIDLLAPADTRDAAWAPLQGLVGTLSGTVKDHPELRWREGIATRLDWADDRLWLLIEPRTVFDGITDDNRADAADFGRERAARRYNRQLNNLIAFWADHLAENGSELRALDAGAGVDAVFRLSSNTGFSRRARA